MTTGPSETSSAPCQAPARVFPSAGEDFNEVPPSVRGGLLLGAFLVRVDGLQSGHLRSDHLLDDQEEVVASLLLESDDLLDDCVENDSSGPEADDLLEDVGEEAIVEDNGGDLCVVHGVIFQ